MKSSPTHPSAFWTYRILLFLWAVGTWAIVRQTVTVLGSTGTGTSAVAEAAFPWIEAFAQSIALFYLLGFLAKAITYVLSPRAVERSGTLSHAGDRSLAVLYLTADDLDGSALDSLFRLEWPGRRLLLVHDDGSDPAARERLRRYLADHPSRDGWEVALWNRPVREGGKAGAVNWVVERLDPSWDYLLLCDSDSIALDSEAAVKAAVEFQDSEVAVVQFRNAGYRDGSEDALHRRIAESIDVFDVFASAQARWGYVPFFGHNAVLRLESLREVGSLTPGFFSDDLDLSVRLTRRGRRIVYRPDVRFAERHPPHYTAFRARSRKWATGCMQVLRSQLPGLLTQRGIPLHHRIGLLEFTVFYPAQMLLLAALLGRHLMPVRGSGTWDGTTILCGTLVVLALFAPTLAWTARDRRWSEWPALAWTCALVYGGSLFATARGVLDGVLGGKRPWIATGATSTGRVIPLSAWLECLLGFAIIGVPWLAGDALAYSPSTYLFAAVFLFSPLTYLAYQPSSQPAEDRLHVPSPRPVEVASLVIAMSLAWFGTAEAQERVDVQVKGNEILVSGEPVRIRGMHYSPWTPRTGPGREHPYPGPELVERDLDRIRDLGANALVLHESPAWVIDQARKRGFHVLYQFSIAWSDTSAAAFELQAGRVLATVDSLRSREGILLYILGHEVPDWVVRQLGAAIVEGRLRSLSERVRRIDPEPLLGHANWPPTKDLDLGFLDVACFNLYPAWPYEVTVRGFGPYLRDVLVPASRSRPLLLTEFGINSLEAGEGRQADVIRDCWKEIESSRIAGGVVFSWADEWWKNYDNPVPGSGFWERRYDPADAERHDLDPEEYYGIVRADRTAKPALAAVKEMWGGRALPAGIPWLVVILMGAFTWLVFVLPRVRTRRKARAAAAMFLFALLALAASSPSAHSATVWTIADTLTGEFQDDQFGWSVAGLGDVDGDRFGDVAVGARFAWVGPDTAAGAVSVFRGGAPGNFPWIKLEGTSDHEHFGESIAGGDVNGDGRADLVVGVPLRDTAGNSSSGAVCVFLGGSTVPPTPWAVLHGEAKDDWFGQSVSCGDMDGDGFDEIIVGAPFNDRAASAAGAAFLYRGSPSGPIPSVVLTGEFPNDQFGWSVAYLGDMDGDGFGDMAVGARLHGAAPLGARGKVYLFRGGAVLDSIPDGAWLGGAKDDWFGNSIAGPGDVDGGGRADLLVGAPYQDSGGSAAGAAYLFRGEDPPGSSPFRTYIGESSNAQFGWAVAGAGDVDADGRPDVAVGARLQASGTGNAAGRAYLFAGGAAPSTTPHGTFDGEAADDWLGHSVGGGIGFVYPGRGAVMAGAPFHDTAASAAGRAYILAEGVRVSVEEDRTMPESPVMVRAAPNPASTSLVFHVLGDARSPIEITVVDAHGRRIIRRVVTPRGLGEWDLTSRDGRPVPSGVYFLLVRPVEVPSPPSRALKLVITR